MSQTNLEIKDFDLSRFNDMPVEILYSVFEHVGFVEKNRLRNVCKLWKDIIDDLLERGTSKEIGEALEIEYNEDHFYQGSEEYSWYLCPKSRQENLCILVGWKVLEYQILAEEADSEFDPDNKESRSSYALYLACGGDLEYKLLTSLRNQFVRYRIELFNHLYGTDFTPGSIGLGGEDVPVLLVLERDNGEMFLEFTLNDAGTFHPYDYKICVRKDPDDGTYKWMGHGDDWLEIEDPREILKRYWNEEEQRYESFNNNIESSTTSHILELIVYGTQKHILETKHRERHQHTFS